MVLRNLTQTPWTVVPNGEELKTVAPGQRVAVRSMVIDFGAADGQIVLAGESSDLFTAQPS